MTDEEGPLRPETVALDALIQATLQRARANADPHAPDTMLFMGNWHQAIPSLVIQDPVLEPIDKLVWMVIMLYARETGSRTAFPSYERLASQTNVASTSTIARAIAILRMTRWLTLCAKVRGHRGQFKGNVYVLHDEPLPLTDALYLDAQYMQWVAQCVKHHHARVRAVAQGVLDSLDDDIRAGQDLSQSEPLLEQRAHVARALSDNAQKNHDGPRRYFAFSADALKQLKKPVSGNKTAENNQDQNSKVVETTQDSSSSSSSCCSDYKTTTTTTPTQNQIDPRRDSQASQAPLIYPARLTDNQRALADRYLDQIEPEARQSVLDELQGRLASEQQGMKPVYDELRFLHALCKAAQKNEFVPNLGLKVAAARQAQQQPVKPAETQRRAEPSAEEKQRTQELGREHLARLKQAFRADKKT